VREPRFFRRSERLAVLPMHLPAARHFDGLGHPPHGLNDDELLFPYTVFFSVKVFEKAVFAIVTPISSAYYLRNLRNGRAMSTLLRRSVVRHLPCFLDAYPTLNYRAYC